MALPHLAIDHVFVCTERGAPAAELLKQAGFTEGIPNRHPGQGTACRRFFFSNFMLEFLWLEDEAEARGEQARGLRLWERFGGPASPFGVILRGSGPCPWLSWSYKPPTMPGLELEIAADAELDEPMWCYMRSDRGSTGVHEVTGVVIGCPFVKAGSVTRAMAESGVIGVRSGVDHLLELEFGGGLRGTVHDFRPELPVVIRG
jgi:hypothetical protein